MEKGGVAYIYNTILCSCTEWWSHAVLYNLDETGEYDVKWNNSEEESQIADDLSYLVL